MMSWKKRMLAELDLDLSRVHFTGHLPRNDYIAVLRVSPESGGALGNGLDAVSAAHKRLADAMSAAAKLVDEVLDQLPPSHEALTQAAEGDAEAPAEDPKTAEGAGQ